MHATMSVPTPGPTATAPSPLMHGTALSMTLARLRKHFWPTLLVMVVMCTAIALFLNSFGLNRLGPKLIYSFAIGFLCWAANSSGRLLVAGWVDRRRRAAGLPLHTSYESVRTWGIWAGVVLGFLIGPALGLSVGDAITGFTSPSLLRLDSSASRITVIITLIGTAVAVYVFSGMERLSSARAEAEAAQRQAAENQLRLLQSQLEPHMLFNTLANLRVLIGLDPARAQAMLDHLIAFLRATLMASRQSSHSLQAEFAHLQDYLALMSVRMGPRLQVQFDLPPDLAGLPVPPLLLQPLVENAIKHGLEPKLAGGRISVQARREGAQLQLLVRDTGVGLRPQPSADGMSSGTSFGLEQVRTRLTTLYGAAASLTLQATSDAEGGTLARIHMPLPARPQP
jgi:Histidine kinase/Histidine kinase-, DNA gyrase B-, and HSP90-like ATPase